MSIDASVMRRVLAAGVCGVGLLLLALSLPRVVAYSYLANVPSKVPEGLTSGRAIDPAVLASAREIYLKALSVQPRDAVILQDVGRLDLRRADDLPRDDERRLDALKAASRYFQASIKAAPARPFPWSLEAYARSQLSASSDEINGLLRMSYFLGPREASSILLRARVGCRNWGRLDEDVRSFVSNDLRALWREGRLHPGLVDIYLEAPLTTRIAIRNVILSDRASEQSFNQMLKKVLRRIQRS